jgi:hypothetical protein
MSKVGGIPTDLAFGDFNICTALLTARLREC